VAGKYPRDLLFAVASASSVESLLLVPPASCRLFCPAMLPPSLRVSGRNHFPSPLTQLRIKFTTVITDTEDKDVLDVMREEKSRGTKRRPANTAEQKKKRKLENDALRAIQSGDLHAFVRMLHEAGVKDGTPAFANALKIFHASAPRR
jgi:hypothetical protein